MKYHESGAICLEYDEFVREGICEAKGTYDSLKAGKKITVYGRGGNGSLILIDYESLPPKYKDRVIAKYGDPYDYMEYEPIKGLVKKDMAARAFYQGHVLPGGGYLDIPYQQEYSRAADWLNMILLVVDDRKALKEHLKCDVTTFWNRVIALHQTDKPINPKLPVTYDSLRKLVNEYKTDGYKSLVSKKFGNQNTRKVNGSIERLILSLYCLPTKPYFTEVAKMYQEFMAGSRKVVDMESGEVFNPLDFYIKQGKGEVKLTVPYNVAAETVKHYVNKPYNRAIVDQRRMSVLEFATTHLPSALRKGPVYSFSKFTMDDTSSPFKMLDNVRPACYKIFDVASGAQLALAMHRKNRPDVPLIRAALAQMMQVIITNDFKMPHEMEVENALTSSMTGNVTRKGAAGERDREKNGALMDVLSAGAAFNYVHFCAPQNPQEKRAEGFINQIKYHLQKHREGFQHRIFARKESNRANQDSDSHKARFTFDEIQQFEYEDMILWNNSEHPDHPGMTRWEVLEQMQNPNLNKPHLPTIMKYVGYKTETSVRRLRVQVQGNLYRLPNISAFESLNNTSFDAYWIMNKEEEIPIVYLYQDGDFVCTAQKEERFQEARAEQTDDDKRILGDQQRYKQNLINAIARKGDEVASVGLTPALSTGGEGGNTYDDEAEDMGKYAEAVKVVEQPVEKEVAIYMPAEKTLTARERALQSF